MNKDCLGNIVKEKRIHLGLTQKELGKRLNVSDKAISKWERGISYPDILKINDLASILETSVAVLLSDDEGREIQNSNTITNEIKNLLEVSRESILHRKRKYIKIIFALILIFFCLFSTIFFMLHKYMGLTQYTIAFNGEVIDKNDDGLIVKEILASNLVMGVKNQVLSDEVYTVLFDDVDIISNANEINSMEDIPLESNVTIWYIGTLNLLEKQSEITNVFRIVLE